MCPTGALKINKDAEGPGLLFNSSLCTGCCLCGDFCPAEALTVCPGYFGKNYDEHDVCNAEVFTVHAVAGKL
jgi:formate hydrogenlyase subunit 6/NADH:ubiquinone oxidoreductase subunit I